jgi:hypothetical protein
MCHAAQPIGQKRALFCDERQQRRGKRRVSRVARCSSTVRCLRHVLVGGQAPSVVLQRTMVADGLCE